MSFKRRALGIGLVLAGLVAGALAGAVVATELDQRNTAEATLIIEVDPAGVDATTQFADAQVLVTQITNGYTALIATPLILDDAIEDLGSDGAGLTSAAVAEATAVSASRTSPTVSIAVTWADPDLAGALANSIAATFVEQLNDGSLPEMPTQVGAIIASVLQEAGVGTPPVDLPDPLLIVAAAVLGGALGALLWLALTRLSGTLRRGESLEQFGIDEFGAVSREHAEKAPQEAAKLLSSTLASRFPGAKVVVLTSTTTQTAEPSASIAVARAFTKSGARTLLVDADFAAGSLGTALNLPEGHGLTEFLQDPDVDPTLTPRDGLGEVMTVGTLTSHPAPVRHGALVRVLSRLRRGYDAIVVHAPAVLRDASTASILDAPGVAIGLTVTPKSDRRTDVRSAVSLIRSLDAPLIGGIVVHS